MSNFINELIAYASRSLRCNSLRKTRPQQNALDKAQMQAITRIAIDSTFIYSREENGIVFGERGHIRGSRVGEEGSQGTGGLANALVLGQIQLDVLLNSIRVSASRKDTAVTDSVCVGGED